ncbi:phosphatidylglycerophosphatase A [Pirellula staleyi DSM 6068]|uniref:Phosphatidylglycerophosphatase A n=1 Tax=Pirellula staleyi (strain ATCC 27377 / DSM 6068 / ICPB 4128) TaxID=530564 RepID=D2R2N8_PIRSD|nr:phosphatidylglycerophosphatase A [Pirellula staleyi]ADB16878.1 phosphatidylglycerophosphatase A [Pirellula staleyi DSM 6068]
MRPPLTLRDKCLWWLATCFGLGCSPFFPGTCGALLAIPIYLATVWIFPSEPAQTIAIGVSLLFWTIVTIVLGGWAEKYWSRKDSQVFVTDEVVGLLATVFLFHLTGAPWTTLAWAFPLTRVIDIAKIPPAKQLEYLPQGWGVVADDLMGSVYTALLLHLIFYLAPSWFGA